MFELQIDPAHLSIHFCVEGVICDLLEVIGAVTHLKKLLWFASQFLLNNVLFFLLDLSWFEYWGFVAANHCHDHIVHQLRQHILLLGKIPFLQIVYHFELDPISAPTNICRFQLMQQ